MEPIKAYQCIWTICTPVNKDDYETDRSKKDAGLTKRFRWSVYEAQIVKPYLKVSKYVLKEGVSIVNNCTFNDFTETLNKASKNNMSVILFAHHEGRYVEFYDKLYSIDEIVGIIPTDGKFIIDLCICQSVDIGESLRMSKNKNILTRFMKNDAIPIFWMYFYLDLFITLNKKNLSYLEAFTTTVKKFMS